MAPKSERVTARRHSLPCHRESPLIAVCRAAMLVGLGCAGGGYLYNSPSTALRAGHTLPEVCCAYCQPATSTKPTRGPCADPGD
eukprot:1258976-Pleurochrysis_carterae.AAC.1